MIPGRLLHRVAAWVCDAKSLERSVAPAIADLQQQFSVTSGHLHRVRVLCGGYLAIVEVIAMSAGRRPTPGVARGVLWGIAAALCAAVAVMVSVFFVLGPPSRLAHLLFGIPLIVPIALPVGFMVGIGLGVGQLEISRRAKRILTGLAVIASVVSMLSVLSTTAVARTSFGTRTGESALSVWKSEMTPARLVRATAAMFSDPGVNRATWGYHMRWSMAFAPIVLLLFTFVLKSRWPAASRATILSACAGYLLLFALGDKLFMDYRHVPLLPLVWMPNIIFAALTLVLMAMRGRPTVVATTS